MIKPIMEQIVPIAAEEADKAKEEHGDFADAHHAFAIAKEEVEETEREMDGLKHFSASAWTSIKNDDDRDTRFSFEIMKEKAMALAAEAIQVAAVCNRYLEQIGEEK